MTDNEAAARAIIDKIRCTPGSVDYEVRAAMWTRLIVEQFERIRQESYESAARVAEFYDARTPDGFPVAAQIREAAK